MRCTIPPKGRHSVGLPTAKLTGKCYLLLSPTGNNPRSVFRSMIPNALTFVEPATFRFAAVALVFP